ncbi:hypothetical protein CC80DRAFT_584479 [Byssothecium circinans]|uniref:Uncharacterized protein n=1 Tax=Byssothecium circinans TaxID=147558 RepID=A0A6A5U4P6_9PLEO|nr:hypothetical protein CC80DRAFT_584479 [Byssothecium circinans]
MLPIVRLHAYPITRRLFQLLQWMKFPSRPRRLARPRLVRKHSVTVNFISLVTPLLDSQNKRPHFPSTRILLSFAATTTSHTQHQQRSHSHLLQSRSLAYARLFLRSCDRPLIRLATLDATSKQSTSSRTDALPYDNSLPTMQFLKFLQFFLFVMGAAAAAVAVFNEGTITTPPQPTVLARNESDVVILEVTTTLHATTTITSTLSWATPTANGTTSSTSPPDFSGAVTQKLDGGGALSKAGFAWFAVLGVMAVTLSISVAIWYH